ncbi:MAG: glycosyltransferase [Terriglobus sp.]
MIHAPSISVVLCTYNGQKFLQEQIDSIAAQTLLPGELIVCDDLSTDSTVDLLNAFAANVTFPVHVYRNDQQVGSTRNFDHALSLAHGDLLVLCDQDDLWEPQKLERLYEVMRDESIGGIFTDATLIDEKNRVMEDRLWARAGFTSERQTAFQRDPVGVLLRQSVATGATMMIRARLRTTYEHIPNSWVHDGWLAWMLVLYQNNVGRLQPLQEPLTRYRVHTSQQTGSAALALGLPTESVAQRMAKARRAGHTHHMKNAAQLQLVLDHWLEHGGSPQASVAHRLNGAIRLLEQRSMLPNRRLRRLIAVLKLLPAYLRYASGWRSAARDFFA